ncbi:YeiH family putative sulfate export transporter [Sedimentibacter sp. zth1]|nr:YeiH family putative sulfate export transporter [Sedimentibacter sp. zth1]
MFSKIVKLIPGIIISLLIALIAKYIEDLLPIHLIGASVIALFIGMIINSFRQPNQVIKPGLKFTSKKILKFAIVLLGASLSIGTVLTIGKMSMMVMCFTLLTCFGGGYVIGRLFGLNWKLSNLISAGTGICGGSAIAAIAPVIEAEDKDIAYAMSATFLFDMVMIVLFPIMGKWLGLSDMAYGLWAGTAVNDTSSVVAAGYAFSEAAGDFATMVKLTRTLAIIPVVLIFSIINARLKKKEALASGSNKNTDVKVNFVSVFPWFILGFIVLAIVNSFGVIPTVISSTAKELSKFLMIAALAAIGLNTSFKEMRKSGVAPMFHGFIISALVVIVAITVEYFMGIV